MKSECVALLLILTLCGGARAATIYVDDNAPADPAPFDPNHSDPKADGSALHPFDSIQKAIDAAVKGDTIIVAPGQYLSFDPWAYAELKFKGKSIHLVSSAPTDFSVADQTILCGVIIFDGTEDPNCLLQGFKIQNYGYGGILGNKTQASISHCIISGNGPCGATVLKDVHGRVGNCLIVDNTTFFGCGVQPVVSGCPELVNCTIANNLSGVDITNADLPAGRTVTLRNCIVYGNQGTAQLLGNPPTLAQVEYCLLMVNATTTATPRDREWPSPYPLYADPCFVQLGYWTNDPIPQAGTTARATRGGSGATKALIEGDYHLKSEGWRWSPEPIHGSKWYYDTVTSLGVSAGDPMDSLGEELERAPGDPEGRCGYNHAIEVGAYGGTAQASLAPTTGDAPGIGAVDLRDYWPLTAGNQWLVHSPQGTARRVSQVGGGSSTSGGVTGEDYMLATSNALDWVANVHCYYADRTFYLTQDSPMMNPLPWHAPQHIQAQYPQFLVAGATMQAPYDPFTKATVEYCTVLVRRGTLTEVLAGTSMTPTQFLTGLWPDVIALREQRADGTIGDPIAIFARGFGPLLLAGQPVEGAIVNSKTFGNAELGTRATRG